MKAKIVELDKNNNYAIILINGERLSVFLDYEESDYEINSELDIELFDYEEDLIDFEPLLENNLEQKKEFKQIINSSYFALGQIVSVDPVVCDCGSLLIDAPIDSSDESLIGMFIGFTIKSLGFWEIIEYKPTIYDKAMDAYGEENYSEALKLFEILAKKDNSTAQYYLGRIYYYGYGTPINYEDAFKYFELSAQQGSPKAQCFLGYMHAEALGVKQSYSSARMNYQIAAASKNRRAMSSLGWMYFKGLGVKPNYSKAYELFDASNELGDSYASAMLAHLYYNGLYVKQCFEEAVKFYQLAVDRGDIHSIYNLGVAYYNGTGVIQNKKEGLKLIGEAAKKGDKEAQYRLSVFNKE